MTSVFIGYETPILIGFFIDFGISLVLFEKTLMVIGGQRQNRTADPLFFRQVLYRLSYLAVSGDDGIRTRDLLRDRQA